MSRQPRDEYGYSMGPIVDLGWDEVNCPWCGDRECLEASKTGPLPDGRTIFYCRVNETPAFRSYIPPTGDDDN